MRRPWAVFLLAAASCSAPRAHVRTPTGDLQPLDVGLEWTYEADGQIQTRKVTGNEQVGRFDCRVVEARTGSQVERSWMLWDREGLKVYRVSDGERTVEYDDPILLIHRRAGPGGTWSFEERYGPVTLAVDAKYEGDEETSVGPRRYSCARIRLLKRVAGRVVVDQTSWYAKDVGLVRLSVVVSDDERQAKTSLQLKSCNFLPE